MQAGEDLRPSVSRSASHVCDSSEGKGYARDGHYVIVGPHHLADDVSVHSRDAAELAQRRGVFEQATFAVSSKKRANIAPSRYWNRPTVIRGNR